MTTGFWFISEEAVKGIEFVWVLSLHMINPSKNSEY